MPTTGEKAPARGLFAIAAQTPEREAIVSGRRRVTFGELDAAASRWARRLQELGVRPGDRVAVQGHNRPELFACWYGAARLGALVVPISYRFTDAEAHYIVEDSGATAHITDADLDDPLEPYDPTPPVTDWLHQAISVMNYTSGTTGQPKGIARPAPAPSPEEFPAQPFAMFWGFTREDTYLLTGPAYHTAPGAYALMHLNEGARIVLMDRWDAEECLRLIEAEGVTTCHMVPANFIRILETDWKQRDLSSIRKILHAAAPCPPSVKRQIMDVFPPDTVWEYFGMSEGFGSVISPAEWLEHPGSVGKAFPGLSISIRDDDGTELPVGEVGTIWVSSIPGYQFSYHNAPEKTAAAWSDNYFTVGDLGHLDQDGYLYIADRRIDLILSGGVNIYPAEIEQRLIAHDEVVDAAVFGVPDERMGQRVHAVVELRAGAAAGAEELTAYLGETLAKYKLPTSYDFVDELPREPNGKVLKHQLREASLTTLGNG